MDATSAFGPGGILESSRTFQGWVRRRDVASPEGTADKEVGLGDFSRPFGTRASGFSLIEMLVVIGVIGILSSLIFPITKAVSRNRIKSRTRAELEQVVTGIEIYHSKRGQYPPDNHYPNGAVNPYVNQLYYELAGTTNSNGDHYQTIDGRMSWATAAAIHSVLSPGFAPSAGVSGFANSRAGGSVEEGSTVINCLKGTLRSDQIASIGNPLSLNVLVGSVPLPPGLPLKQWPNLPPNPTPYPGSAQIVVNSPTAPWYCAWRYNSSSPTNNPGTYDLWIDVIIDGKTNRFSNWSHNPVIVGTP